MFASLSVDAKDKRWHAKAVHRAIAARRAQLSAEALERLRGLSVEVEVRPVDPAVELAGERVLVQLDCRGWTSLEKATPAAVAQFSKAVDALLAHLGLSQPPGGVELRVVDPAAPQEVFEAIRTAIRARVTGALGPGSRVVYDAFPLGSDGLPVDNLDRVAFEGPCRVEAEASAGVTGYCSRLLGSPTWLQLATVADQLLKATGEREKVLLEGLSPVRVDDGVTVLELQFGS